MKNNRNINPIIISVAVVYLIISIVGIITVAPYAFNGLRYMLIDIDNETAILIFILSLFVSTAMISLLFMHIKHRYSSTTKKHETYESIISLHGDYSEERRYLEDKINELADRLTDTEVKWKNINHLIISANEKNIENSGRISPEKFLKDFGIDINNVKIEKDLAFVLTPSSREFVRDYLIVRDTCADIKMRAIRGDETDLNYTHGSILTHIINHMVKARIVIANISNRNPNVCYELGIAHMMGKPTILLCRNGMEVPFDLKHKYIIFYDDDNELAQKLNDALLKIITIE